MAIFLNIDERVLFVVLAVALIVLWAVLAPESFRDAVSTGQAVIDGAVSGAQSAA